MTTYAQQIAAAAIEEAAKLCDIGAGSAGEFYAQQIRTLDRDAIIASVPQPTRQPEAAQDDRRKKWQELDYSFNAERAGLHTFHVEAFEEGWQAAKRDALNRSEHPETEAWLIEWHDADGHKRRVSGHNSIADYRMLFPDATVAELVRRDALTQARELTDDELAEHLAQHIDCWHEIENEDRGDIFLAARALLSAKQGKK